MGRVGHRSSHPSYLYDENGIRIKKTVGATTTLYPFGHYEVSGTTVKKYYTFGGMTIAMRTGSTLQYLHTDHLGSVAAVTDSAGVYSTNQSYFAYGKKRAGGTLPTTINYTGQRLDGSGLVYMNARYYDPLVGMFISPDTIVPDMGVLIDYNRFAYARANPLKYNDPSGHEPCGTMGDCTVSDDPLVTSQQSFRINMQQWGIPLAKVIAKEYWGCVLPGGCYASQTDWTASVDLGGMWAPVGPTARAQGSIAVDSDGGIALIGAFGGGGSTPVVSGGLTFSATNAPSVNNLSGMSVQAGGSAGTVYYAEGIFFRDDETGETYFGASVAPATRLSVTYFPPPLEGSIHGTAQHSSVFSTNFFDLIYAPLEWFFED